MEQEDGFIHHETLIDKEDARKLWTIYGDSRKFEELQEHEIGEFLDEIIDELIQSKI